MPKIPDGSVDMILCDLPYGTTACKWDVIIPFESLWKEYERIIKDNGAIILTASQPFTTMLIMSNMELFKYTMVWVKDRPSDFGNANIKPMYYHEDVCVFYKSTPPYNKQFIKRSGSGSQRMKYPVNIGVQEGHQNEHGYGTKPMKKKYKEDGLKICGTVITIPIERRVSGQHPTQKPVALFEHLIKTYTNENELILDNCIGSGTTAVACINTNRNFIGIELDEEYHKMAVDRVSKTPRRL